MDQKYLKTRQGGVIKARYTSFTNKKFGGRSIRQLTFKHKKTVNFTPKLKNNTYFKKYTKRYLK